MLETLRIRNLALVTDLTLELGPGYNAISGETGAGKSILIGALNLVLGERADRTLIRAEADQCMVEATFDVA
ncbi:MAG: AAA family ATPase, partial [Verrucomicrobiota bacterium]|nr:AAA family ATPase [Verrucomicrobiota bacterium]